MADITSSRKLGLLLLVASSSLSLIQGDTYCSYGTSCDGNAKGGTWCNEHESNCEEQCGGKWCSDESDLTLDKDVKQYKNDDEYQQYMPLTSEDWPDITDDEPTTELDDNQDNEDDYEDEYNQMYMSSFDDLPATGANEEPPNNEGFYSYEEPGYEQEDDNEEEYRYIVKFNDSEDGLARARRMESRALKEQLIDILPEDNAEVLKLTTEEEVHAWEERDDVEYVEKDQKVYLSGESTTYGINMVKALSISDGSVSNRKVCIVDSGYDINHPDLPKGTVVTGTSATNAPWNQDTNSHGTHVAGTIAAIGGNGQGVVGVVRNGHMKLHIVRVFGMGNSWVWTSNLVGAVEECQRVGANIVNMSVGRSGSALQLEKNAYQRMYNDGMLLVASAGNGGDTSYRYPASYDSVMSVAAVDSSKRLASFSQRNDQVDIAAPGVGVISTMPGGGYGSKTGTSMASPHVAGVAALIWSHFPNKSAQEIRQALEKTAQDLGTPGRDNSFGHGLVQADKAFDYIRSIFYRKQQNNCGSVDPFSQSLSAGECEAYANSLDKEYCDSCGIKAWGNNSNGRPKGCFVDNGYPDYVFYNPGGNAYPGTSYPSVSAICLHHYRREHA